MGYHNLKVSLLGHDLFERPSVESVQETLDWASWGIVGPDSFITATVNVGFALAADDIVQTGVNAAIEDNIITDLAVAAHAGMTRGVVDVAQGVGLLDEEDAAEIDELLAAAEATRREAQDVMRIAEDRIEDDPNMEGRAAVRAALNTIDQRQALSASAAAAGHEYEALPPEQQAARNRFAEQCYLVYNLTELAAYHKRGQQFQSKDPVYELDGVFPAYQYKYTHILESNRHGELMSKLRQRPGTENMIDATPAQLAELVPKIKISKVIYDESGAIANEIPITFYNHTITELDAKWDWADQSEGVHGDELGTFAADTSEFKSPGGFQARSAVGIRSFDWNYIATNPDTIRNDLTAKLVLFFQSFDELTRTRHGWGALEHSGYEDDWRYLDLIVQSGTGETESTIESDTPDNVGCGNSGRVQYDSSQYEIKAVVGWASPGGAGTNLDEAMTNSVNYNQVPLFLTLEDHEFGIEEDGTFTLTISYRGRLDGALSGTKANILLSGGAATGTTSAASFGDTWDTIREFQKEIQELSEICADDAIREKIKDNKQSIIGLKDELRDSSYRLLLNLLTKPHTSSDGLGYPDIDAGQKLIYTLPVSREVIFGFSDTNRVESRDEDGNLRPPGFIPPTAIEPGQAGAGIMGDVDAHIKTDGETDLKEKQGERGTLTRAKFNMGWGEALDPTAGTGTVRADLANYHILDNWDPGKPETQLINFFYLGDLVDITAKIVFGNTEDQSFYTDQQNQKSLDVLKRKYAFKKSEVEHLRVLLGPFEYVDPKNGITKNINIADIPISVRMFVDFFHRKVIKPQKDTYAFAAFIRDLIKDLAMRALGDQCFAGAGRLKANLRTIVIDGPGYQEGGTVTDPVWAEAKDQNLPPGPGETVRLNMDEINYDSPLFPPTGWGTDLANFYQYIVIYAQGPSGLVHPSQLPPRDAEDVVELATRTPREYDMRNRGIHHLHIGRDRGLVRRVQFKKTDAPALREARVETAGSYDPIQQLSNVYELTIEMAGNTYFYPGSYLYFNPFGLGQKLEQPYRRGTLSNIMGLGGYHIITNVKSFIESGEFKTVVEARFDSTGDGCRITSAEEDTLSDCPEAPSVTI